MTALQLAFSYWNAEAFLLISAENGAIGWRDEHSTVLPLIDRSLLESACNVIFLVEDLDTRAVTFTQAGWRDAKIELEKLERAATSEDGPMQDYLDERRALVERGRLICGITEEQAANATKIHTWPPVTKMKDYGFSPGSQLPTSRELIGHLVENFYKELSGIAHSDGYAQLLQGAFVAGRMLSEERREILRSEKSPLLRSASFLRSSAFLMCVICEIQQLLKYKENLVEVRILRVWELISTQIEIRHIYEKRYKSIYDLPDLSRAR